VHCGKRHVHLPIPTPASVAHSFTANGGKSYALYVECENKFGNPLPANTHTISGVTDE